MAKQLAVGSAEHTDVADNTQGLPGAIFASDQTHHARCRQRLPRLVNDVFLIPGADRGEIALVDLDRDRLATMYQIVKKLAEKHGKTGWKITAAPRRRAIMAGSDYLVSCIEVSGLACVRHDNDIPAKFDLGADAAIHRSVELAIQALTLDPLTAACCSPAEIKKMTLELFAAEKKFLKGSK